MKAESKRSVRIMLRWLLGVATVLMAALLIWQCVTIYHEGIAPENMGENGLRIHDIYSREIVTAHFASIAWSVWVFLALLAANIIAGKPEQKESLRAPVENQLLMLRARTEETDEIRKVKKQCIGVWCGAPAFTKLGRLPLRTSAYSVNWDIDSTLPSTSWMERFILPFSSSKTRRLAILRASQSICFAPSVSSTPTSST